LDQAVHHYFSSQLKIIFAIFLDVGFNGRGVEPDNVSLAPSFIDGGEEGLLVEYSKETL
jgi:hypothetical protein